MSLTDHIETLGDGEPELMPCPKCNGTGEVIAPAQRSIEHEIELEGAPCPECRGYGEVYR